jgi:hypothetical protein
MRVNGNKSSLICPTKKAFPITSQNAVIRQDFSSYYYLNSPPTHRAFNSFIHPVSQLMEGEDSVQQKFPNLPLVKKYSQ